MDNRGAAPVVGKVLAAGLVVLYVGGMTGLLLGGPVPAQQTAAASELGERVLATAASHVEATLPAADGRVRARTVVSLPPTIRDETYTLRIDDGRLVLDHPVDALDSQTRLAVGNVTVADGTWHSTDRLVVSVTGPPGDRTLRLGAS